jgi:hypothetical protein
MNEEKEEKLSISYQDFSSMVIRELIQGMDSKVKNFINKIGADVKKAQKPYVYRVLMKQLVSVRPTL